MATRKDPAIGVLAFFDSAPIETAQTVLAIAKGILAKRRPAAKSQPRIVKRPTTAAAEG